MHPEQWERRLTEDQQVFLARKRRAVAESKTRREQIDATRQLRESIDSLAATLTR